MKNKYYVFAGYIYGEEIEADSPEEAVKIFAKRNTIGNKENFTYMDDLGICAQDVITNKQTVGYPEPDGHFFWN